MDIKIPYSPRGWAKEFHESKQRWKVLVMHRRSGKTTACINHLIRDACHARDSRFAYVAPYYKQAKAVAWDMLKYYSRPIPNVKINESELKVDYPNGARIQLFGADNPDALRGLALWGVIFDEYSQQPSSIFTEVIRPALSDHEGYAIWIGTPKGMNDFFRLYDKHKEDEDWFVKLLKASQSELIKPEELADARKGMSPDEYAQEFECSFTAAIKGAYYSHQLLRAREENRITTVPHDSNLRVDTYWDLGISDSTSIIFAQTAGREIHVIDFYQTNGQGLDHYVKILDSKPYLYGKHVLPHDAKARELGTGRSREEVLKNLMGRDTIKVGKQLQLKDGIDAGRALFSRCWFDEKKCIELLDALGSYTQEWDDKKGMFRDNPMHNWASHAADAFRYMACGYKEDVTTQSNPISTKYSTSYPKINPWTGSKPVTSKYSNRTEWTI